MIASVNVEVLMEDQDQQNRSVQEQSSSPVLCNEEGNLQCGK